MASPFPLAILLPAALLAGCAGDDHGIETVNQPVVTRTALAFDLGLSGDALAPGEAERLAGWMRSLGVGYGDRVAVDDPSRYAGTAHAEIARVAGALGLLLDRYAPVTGGDIAPGTIRVTVARTRADVPRCAPGGEADMGHGDDNPRFGCAINGNLAAMVAHSDDLVIGRPATGLTDPDVNTKAIDVFRRTVPTGAGGLRSEAPGAAAGGNR